MQKLGHTVLAIGREGGKGGVQHLWFIRSKQVAGQELVGLCTEHGYLSTGLNLLQLKAFYVHR